MQEINFKPYHLHNNYRVIRYGSNLAYGIPYVGLNLQHKQDRKNFLKNLRSRQLSTEKINPLMIFLNYSLNLFSSLAFLLWNISKNSLGVQGVVGNLIISGFLLGVTFPALFRRYLYVKGKEFAYAKSLDTLVGEREIYLGNAVKGRNHKIISNCLYIKGEKKFDFDKIRGINFRDLTLKLDPLPILWEVSDDDSNDEHFSDGEEIEKLNLPMFRYYHHTVAVDSEEQDYDSIVRFLNETEIDSDCINIFLGPFAKASELSLAATEIAQQLSAYLDIYGRRLSLELARLQSEDKSTIQDWPVF